MSHQPMSPTQLRMIRTLMCHASEEWDHGVNYNMYRCIGLICTCRSTHATLLMYISDTVSSFVHRTSSINDNRSGVPNDRFMYRMVRVLLQYSSEPLV